MILGHVIVSPIMNSEHRVQNTLAEPYRCRVYLMGSRLADDVIIVIILAANRPSILFLLLPTIMMIIVV